MAIGDLAIVINKTHGDSSRLLQPICILRIGEHDTAFAMSDGHRQSRPSHICQQHGVALPFDGDHRQPRLKLL